MKEDVLPEGWEIKKLENLADILDSQRKPINSKEREKRIQGKSDKKLFPYYGATGEVGKIDDYLFDEELVALGEDGVPFLDFNKDKAYMLYGKTWVNNHAHVLRAKKEITENKFLYYFLNQFDYRDYVNGGTRLKLTQANMRKIPVITPPLPEQQYLSQKLTALLDEVAQTKQRLEAIPALLKQFRQSVLADAVSGRLTEKWREENGGILSEGKISDFVTFSPRKDKLEDDLVVSFSSMHLMSEKVSEHLTFEEKHWKDVKKGFTFFKNNDVLLAKITPCFENGKSAVAQNLINGIGTGSTEFMVLRCNENILPKYLYFNLNTDSFRQNGALNMSGSVGHKRVPKEFVLNWNIVLPSPEEQTQIVQKVETNLALADKIETQVNAALENVNLLTQSILAKAFSGELSAAWREENSQFIK